MLVGVGRLLRRRPGSDPAFAAVIADVVHRSVVDDCSVVGVVDDRGVHMIHVGVVGEMTVLPTTALIAHPAIAKAVVDAAIEADVRSPITLMPEERAAAPSPVAGRPQEPDLRRQDPGPRHPVVAIEGIVGPVARRPKVTFRRTNGLLIDGQRAEGRSSRKFQCRFERMRYGRKPATSGENNNEPIANLVRIIPSFCLLILFRYCSRARMERWHKSTVSESPTRTFPGKAYAISGT